MKAERNIKIFIKTFFVLSVIVSSCVKFDPVPIIPEISFVSFEIFDAYDSLGNKIKAGTLEFEYIDGDADIGVPWYIKTDTNGIFSDSEKYNFVITVNEKIGGVYRPKIYWNMIENKYDTLIINQTIEYDPKLDRTGQNKTIKGVIRANIPITTPQELKDTFNLEFFIRDRALHKSNVEYSNDCFIEQ